MNERDPYSSLNPKTAAMLLEADELTVHFTLPRVAPWRTPAVVHALDAVSLYIRSGETLGLVGETGCGKSTVARSVLRLQEVDSGRINFRGIDITHMTGEALRSLRRHMQPIFQDPYASLNPRSTVTDIVAEPLIAHRVRSAEIAAKVHSALQLVGVSQHLARRYPHQLSGGQRQRVGIARAIVLEPQLIVADEPLSALDVSIQAQVLNLLMDLQDRLRLTYLFISHDLRVVRHISDRIAIMYLGKVVEEGPAELVCSAPAHHYTAALLASVPGLATTFNMTDAPEVKGEPPSPINPPSGCRFHPRCPRATQICQQTEPLLADFGDGRRAACHHPLVFRLPADLVVHDGSQAERTSRNG
jgi:oligopeptide/dipeptide ABC transporter ATP-binding protein